jgi:hypothetical protein
MTMKTTYDLPEDLVQEVNRIARERGVPARDLVRAAITKIIDEDAEPKPFVLKDMSVEGELAPEFANATFAEILEASYGDRA